VAKLSIPQPDRNGVWPGHTRPTPTAQIHIIEIAEILAAGLMRLVGRKSSPISTDTGDSSLDFSATKSSDPTQVDRRISDG